MYLHKVINMKQSLLVTVDNDVMVNIIFQEDNAPKNTAASTKIFFGDHGIYTFEKLTKIIHSTVCLSHIYAGVKK